MNSIADVIFINRILFVALLGFLFAIGYIWKRFKPEGWELTEFEYHPGTAQDAPDDPLTLSGSGMLSTVFTPSPQMREPEDLERYREFVGHMRALEKMKREGVVRPEELSTERKELMMRRPGYPFYPRRRSLLTLKTLAIAVIAFLILVLIIMSSA